MEQQSTPDTIQDIRRFNRDFTVRLDLLKRYRFDSPYSLVEARVLLEIGRAGRQTHSGLLAILRIDQGYLSRILAKLKQDGLVGIAQDENDGRSKTLFLSAAGVEAYQAIDRQSDAQVEALVGHLDQADREQLARHMAGIDELLGQTDTDGITFRFVSAPARMDEVAALFQEYVQGLGVDLAFQDFAAELAGLPGKYAVPQGAILLAWDGDQAAGCVALRPMDKPGFCEMKRLFVRPAWRSRAIGRRLAERIIAKAAAMEYRAMRLDTLASLGSACRLYRQLGFREIAAYYDNPLPDVVYFEKDLM